MMTNEIILSSPKNTKLSAFQQKKLIDKALVCSLIICGIIIICEPIKAIELVWLFVIGCLTAGTCIAMSKKSAFKQFQFAKWEYMNGLDSLIFNLTCQELVLRKKFGNRYIFRGSNIVLPNPCLVVIDCKKYCVVIGLEDQLRELKKWSEQNFTSSEHIKSTQ